MRKFVTALAILFVSVSAFAQEPVTDEEFGVTATVPATWQLVEDEDRAVFNLKHEDHSQIEIIGNELMTPDVGEVFFTHFHDTLQSSDFVQVGREDKQIGEFSGSETIYRFEHSGVTLKVTVFQFIRDTTAWIAVGYMQEDVFDAHAPEFRALVESLTFAE